MCTNALAELEPDAQTTKRAQYEAFEFAVDAPGLIRVTNVSYGDDADDHSYLVNIEDSVPTACECSAFEYQNGACKHIVAIAIREPVLKAATTEAVPDGGELVDADGRPADCDCLPTFEGLPCWPCYRDGFRSPNPDADEEADR